VHAPVSVRIESRDADGVLWAARVRDRTDADGRVLLPLGGLIGAMQPSPIRSNLYYIWSREQQFRLTATQGATRLRATFVRRVGSPDARFTTLARDGIFGAYYAPGPPVRKPALLIFGGSEGGLSSSFLAATLAARGFPTLAVAYFGEPGLPQKLHDVPLEYFVRALRWLDHRRGVDPSHVFVLGISRGSEAAQLLGVHFPTLVHGVVAVVPSDFVNACYPACSGSGWSLRGRPIPFTGVGFPEGIPAYAQARIPDERIAGPVLMICGSADLVWPSCPYARDAMRHLRSSPYPHELIVEPRAGHGLGLLVPYEPDSSYLSGAAEERGREDAWPKLLAFLRDHD
jgi:pimeloyl-ACP methyl ester carboxylesterase